MRHRNPSFAPGSFPWLVAHDLRLNWRRFVDMFGGATPVKALGMTLFGVACLHALAWPALPWIAQHVQGAATGPESRLALAGFLICVTSWMTAQGLFAATRTLYDRGDLDLLLGSPQLPGRILAAKALAIALSSLGSVAVLALPVANAGAVRYGWHWLAFYPTLASMALIATSFSLMVTLALFQLMGPRRARVCAQLGGAVIGGAFVLGAQIVAMLPDAVRARLTEFMAPVVSAGGARTGGPLWLPVDALLASPSAMLTLVAIAVALFAAATALLGDRFQRVCLDAAGAPSTPARKAPHGSTSGFKSGAMGALRRKEWRLLLRDPGLFAQLGLQIVYTIPLAVVLVRSGSLPIALALTPAIVVITGQVAASLAWIAISGEDAPELIASAPVSPRAVDGAKLAAIALPVMAVAAVPLVGLAFISWRSALIAGAFAAGASASTGLLNLWHPMPGNRRGMLRRHSQSKVIGLIEHTLAILFAIGAVLALLGSQIWMVAVAIAVAVLCHGKIVGAGRWVASWFWRPAVRATASKG